jgi:hypothetical protein
MKIYIYLAIAIICILGLAIFVSVFIPYAARDIGADLPFMAAAIEREDWQAVEQYYTTTEAKWHKYRPIWQIFIDHRDMTDLDVAFIHLKAILPEGNKTEIRKEFAGLEYYLEHIPLNEKVSWDNIF